MVLVNLIAEDAKSVEQIEVLVVPILAWFVESRFTPTIATGSNLTESPGYMPEAR